MSKEREFRRFAIARVMPVILESEDVFSIRITQTLIVNIVK